MTPARARTRTTWSGVERTNCEATAKPFISCKVSGKSWGFHKMKVTIMGHLYFRRQIDRYVPYLNFLSSRMFSFQFILSSILLHDLIYRSDSREDMASLYSLSKKNLSSALNAFKLLFFVDCWLQRKRGYSNSNCGLTYGFTHAWWITMSCVPWITIEIAPT